MSLKTTRIPKLALPFTILPQKNVVRLVAGEEFRYTFEGEQLDQWFPALLKQLDGKTSIKELLKKVEPARKETALELLQKIYAERIIVDATVSNFHAKRTGPLQIEGALTLKEQFQQNSPVEGESLVALFGQDNLDFQKALQFNEDCLNNLTPFMWVSYGAMSRAYISPLFLPDAGPCLNCLFTQFKQRSPFPELYDALIKHDSEETIFQAVSFPEEALALLKNLVLWKISLREKEEPSPPLYRLHVLEINSLEVSSYRVRFDPECSLCSHKKR